MKLGRLPRGLAVAAVEDKYRADFLRDVLTGRGGPRIAARASSFGWDLERPVGAFADEAGQEIPFGDRQPAQKGAVAEQRGQKADSDAT